MSTPTPTPPPPPPPSEAETPAEASTPSPTPPEADSRAGVGASKVRLAVFVAAGLLVALALAFFVSPEASSKPDGLNKVAIDEGFADEEAAHDLEDGPLAGYGVEGVDDERLGTGLAGVTGVAVTFLVAGGIVLLVRLAARRRADNDPANDDTTVAADTADTPAVGATTDGPA